MPGYVNGSDGSGSYTTPVLAGDLLFLCFQRETGNATIGAVATYDNFVFTPSLPGAAPYTYDWDNDAVGDNDDDATITGLSPGPYNVIVTDINGCSNSTTVTVGEPDDIFPTIIPGGALDLCDGESIPLSATTTPGGLYSYSWILGAGSGNIDGTGAFKDADQANSVFTGTLADPTIDGTAIIELTSTHTKCNQPSKSNPPQPLKNDPLLKS